MVIIGCCTVPSWPGVLDLDMEDIPDSAHQLHVSAKYIGDYVHDLRPDIIGNVTCRSDKIRKLIYFSLQF